MLKGDKLKDLLDRISSLVGSLRSRFDDGNLELLESLAADLKRLTENSEIADKASSILSTVLEIRKKPRKRNDLLDEIVGLSSSIYTNQKGMTRRGFLKWAAATGAAAMLKPSKLFASAFDGVVLEDAYGKKYFLNELHQGNETTILLVALTISAGKKMEDFCKELYSKVPGLNRIRVYKFLTIPRWMYSFAIGKIRDLTPSSEVPYLLIDWGDKYLSEIFKTNDSDEIIVIILNKNGEVVYSSKRAVTEQDFSNIRNISRV